MDFIDSVWNSIKDLFTKKTDSVPTSTDAPLNLYPIDFDMSTKPTEPTEYSVQHFIIRIFTSPTLATESESLILSKPSESPTENYEEIVTNKVLSGGNEVNVLYFYIVLIMGLIILMGIIGGIVFWCKNNKLRSEKRNKYPVFSVTNSEYMNPKDLEKNS
ncbi:hypothetical protein ABEB36_014232 [Hypothenemus hampei]|uniref:Uncharacterized protein n=1 Tax=Hypothenemus hampei TaxID=57062 RepID=A0ABD1E3P8_HYPHA